MAVAMLIGLWIWDELSFDHYFKDHDKIVLLMQHQTINNNVITQTSMPIPLGLKLEQDYKSDFKYIVLCSWTYEHILTFGDKKLTQVGTYMQAEAPDMLTLHMLRGSRSGLKDPSSILLSETSAKAIFGAADPMLKTIKIDNQFNVKVTGVYEDLPRNTTFSDVTFIAPWDLYMTTIPYLKRAATQWGNNSWPIFAELNANADINKVSARIKDLKMVGLGNTGDKVGEFKNGVNTGGAIQFVWMFGIIGVFVLLLACINFMNLSTARSESRAKEVGIRKTVGSLRSQLIGQFFSESLMVADKNMRILWDEPLFWIMVAAFSLLTGIIAGSYPAFYLSSFQPVQVLKGTFKAGRFATLPRKILVVLQFAVSVTLIIGTVIVFRQVQFTKNRPVGYQRAGLIQMNMKTDAIHKSFLAVRNDLIQSGAVLEMAESGSPPTGVYSNNSGLTWRGKDPNLQDDFGTIAISPEFGKTVDWHLAEGRDLLRAYVSDSSSMIANEAAIKFMKLKHPIGEIIKWGKDYKIIGVVKDMVMSSPYEPVKPSLFFLADHSGDVVDIRINPKISMQEALSKIEVIFKKYDPESPFDYKFTDAEYAKKFADEERIGKLAGAFTILAIFISCMGLFGMASFMAEQRTKEIGVRKVLGASVFGLWKMLSTDFVMLVTIALLIAIP
eukprot:gene18426-18700_t